MKVIDSDDRLAGKTDNHVGGARESLNLEISAVLNGIRGFIHASHRAVLRRQRLPHSPCAAANQPIRAVRPGGLVYFDEFGCVPCLLLTVAARHSDLPPMTSSQLIA